MKRLAVAAIAAACVMAAVPVLYYSGFLPTTSVVTGGQVQEWNTHSMTRFSHMIFEGTVKSTETRLVHEITVHENLNGTYVSTDDRHVPYNYVTVSVTEWLKDSSGRYPDQVTYRDSTTGAIGRIDGEPAWFQDRNAVDYYEGEKGIFFVELLEGELRSSGSLQVFRYNDDGGVYLPYFEDLTDPLNVDELKAEVRANS